MADRVDEETRSEMMSSISGTGNRSTEWALRSRMVADGMSGFELHADLPGSPDFVFPDEKVAVFTDGCFWHGCPEHYSEPDNNNAFWVEKIGRNIERDAWVDHRLRMQGWSVVRIWEHQLQTDPGHAVAKVREALRDSGRSDANRGVS